LSSFYLRCALNKKIIKKFKVKHTNKVLIFSGIAFILSLCAFSGLLFLYTRAPQLRVAYVNTDKLFNSYQAMLTARRVYQGEKQEWEHNLETLGQEARLAQEARQRLGTSGSAQQRAASEETLRLKQQQFFNYQAAVQKQGPVEMQRLTQPVVDAANHYLTTYSKQQQYDLVLSAGGGAEVVYVAEPLDITERVVQGLNQALADSLRHTSPRPTGPASENKNQ
jgi:Skp family chaperone for outer membrane proteins